MFYRIFLYKMFASSIFIFTFATENKYPMYPIRRCANLLYSTKAHSQTVY